MITLHTERLTLRPFTEDDLPIYTARIFGDAEVMRYLPASERTPQDRARRTMDYFNQQWQVAPYAPWAVVETTSGELIGHCGLRLLTDINKTEVLYALGKDYWNKGYATEAARASVKFGFEERGLDEIIALAVPANLASRRVMEHCGLRCIRDAHMFDMDVVYYALGRVEYDAERLTHDE